MQETNDYLNLNFRDIGLKDALIGGTGDPDDIKMHEHYDNLSVELWSDSYICSIKSANTI